MIDASISDCFVTYIEFWYRLGISPCKLKINPETKIWKVTSSRIHKILSVCAAVILFLSLYAWVRNLISTESPEDNYKRQINYFEKATVFGLFFEANCFLLSFWRRGNQFADFVNYSQTSAVKATLGTGPTKNGKRKFVFVMSAMTVLYIITEILRFLELNSWNFSSYLAGMAWWGRSLIFLEYVKFGTWTEYVDHIGIMFGVIADLVLVSFKSAGVTLMLILMLQMHRLIQHLENTAYNTTAHDGVQEFRKFRTLVDMLNTAVGLAICGCVFGRIPAVIKCIPQLIQPIGVVPHIDNISFTLIPILFLICAAWFNAKAETIFHNWILVRKNFVLFQESDLIMLLHEISSEKLAIKPIEFVSLDSSFLGTVFGLILTFSVVIIQFESQK